MKSQACLASSTRDGEGGGDGPLMAIPSKHESQCCNFEYIPHLYLFFTLPLVSRLTDENGIPIHKHILLWFWR